MCLILTVWDDDPRFRLVIAANRDEFHDRPTAPASFWHDDPGILAGRDLRAGGTWMGLTRSGRFAAITNYADHQPHSADAPSRGSLVAEFLRGNSPPLDYLNGLARRGDEYAGFSIFTATPSALAWHSNRGGAPRPLGPGRYGLANALLDSDWPKIAKGKELVASALAKDLDPDSTTDELLHALEEGRDQRFEPDPAADPEAREAQQRSRIFLRHAAYGTRASTVILIGRNGEARLVEQSWTADGRVANRAEFRFTIEEKHG